MLPRIALLAGMLDPQYSGLTKYAAMKYEVPPGSSWTSYHSFDSEIM